MSEIEKMYENAGVKSFKTCEFCTQKHIDCLKENISNITCGLSSDMYPPFTAEKQLRIMELLVRKGMLLFTFSTKGNYKVSGFCRGSNYCSDINEAFANYINTIWQDLTEEEKQQVKGILE